MMPVSLNPAKEFLRLLLFSFAFYMFVSLTINALDLLVGMVIHGLNIFAVCECISTFMMIALCVYYIKNTYFHVKRNLQKMGVGRVRIDYK